MKKGQVAVEFFAYAGIFLIVLMITLSIIYFAQNAEYDNYRYNYVVEVGKGFASSYSLAVRGGNGFEYTHYFPKTILGYEYTVTFIKKEKQNFMQINIPGETEAGTFTYSYPLPFYPFEAQGCIEQETENGAQVGHMVPAEGNDYLGFYNDGEKVIITHGGCQ
ncbi:hypothetical protein JXB01_04590 [Candidatus Micrarchaeota archaeon]|nr:hypothetical protein [Candidatus Micrarchaeota archaeon]